MSVLDIVRHTGQRSNGERLPQCHLQRYLDCRGHRGVLFAASKRLPTCLIPLPWQWNTVIGHVLRKLLREAQKNCSVAVQRGILADCCLPELSIDPFPLALDFTFDSTIAIHWDREVHSTSKPWDLQLCPFFAFCDST